MKCSPSALPAAVLLVLAVGGCGDDESADPTPEPVPTDPCPAPNRLLADGRCLEPGVQDDGCAAGTLGLDEGSCQPAGTPPSLCAQGFEAAGDGCEPILPAEPCPAGQMAVPGEASCRPVMSCGVGRWGDLPVDGATVYVDDAYPGGDSDGSEARPWTTIGDAVLAAPSGALVAIAAGSYAEDVLIAGKVVRLWGVCPELVEVTGSGVELAPVFVGLGASGAEVGGLAITGPSAAGVLVSGAQDVVLDRLWIHHLPGRGVDVEAWLGPAAITARGLLVEVVGDKGVFVLGAAAEIEDSVVRDTHSASSDPTSGEGIYAQSYQNTASQSVLHLRRVVVEETRSSGIRVRGSEAQLESVVVRGTLPRTSDGTAGFGISVDDSPSTGHRSLVDLRSSLLERNLATSFVVQGSDATVEGCSLRLTAPQGSDDAGGHGVHVLPGTESGARSTLVITSSVIEHNHEFGIYVTGSDATVRSTIARSNAPSAVDLALGRGIGAVSDLGTGERSTLDVAGCLVTDNHDLGISVAGADASVLGSVVRGTLPSAADQYLGRGIGVQADPITGAESTLWIHGSVLEQNHELGVFSSGTAIVVEASVVRGTLQRPVDQRFGRGVHIQADPAVAQPGHAVLRSSMIIDNHEVGVWVSSSEATVDRCLIAETKPIADGRAGDGLIAHSAGEPASVFVDASRIEHSARAAVSSFGALISLGTTSLSCQRFDLAGESLDGRIFRFEDRGGNLCGCPVADGACDAESVGLEPPQQL